MTQGNTHTTQDLTWEDIQRDARTLANHLAVTRNFRGIVAVSRGGLIPAGLLASLLDVRLVDTMCIVTYEGQKAASSRTIKAPLAALATLGAGWLVVDDLVDSGATFKAIREVLPKAYYAALYAKPEGIRTADSFVTKFSQDVWLNFPWEI